MSRLLTRRGFLGGSAAGAGTLLLGGCDRLTQSDSVQRVLRMAESLTIGTQRALLSGGALAKEFNEADLSPIFKSNGTSLPEDRDYARMMATNFTDWRLSIDGLVRQPLSLSPAELKRLPSRTQIKRHDCVEGWSAIGKWTGVPLGLLLQTAGLTANARYAVFHCADALEQTLVFCH
jgi:DMSO/TMAO reductase YedYZ molybdopterin-dependent catalytic subunit